jgi:hypothetical protein
MSQEVENYQDAFARIERQVEAGNADLSGLGFWRLVRSIKTDHRLAHHWAEVVGRIDRRAFETRVRPRFPVALGNVVLLAAGAVAAALVPVAVALARRDPEGVLPGLALLVAGGGLGAALHDPAHWAAGRLAGIRFTHYFLDGPLRIQPGIKIDYTSYLRAAPGGRAWMHAAGAIVTKAAPFAVFAAAYLPHRSSGYVLFPAWSLWAVLGVGVVQILTDVVWSRTKSDWKKVRRERLVGRAQDARGGR